LSFAVSSSGSVSPGASAPPSTTPTPPDDPTTPDPPDDPTTPDPPTPPDPTNTETLTFTQNVDGYTGTQDLSISNLYYSSSSPTGAVYKTNDMLYAYTLGYTTKALLRFDVSRIPATASVVSATLAVTAQSWTNSQSLIGNFLAIGWTNTGAGSSWSVPGIGPTDLTGPRFLVTGIDASGYQRKTVELDPESVERWIRDPAANQGVILTNPNTQRVLRIYSSEAANAAQRPTLSVTFEN
jgi:hypothetical protein